MAYKIQGPASWGIIDEVETLDKARRLIMRYVAEDAADPDDPATYDADDWAIIGPDGEEYSVQ